jgi:hypothetical protein
VAPRPVRRGIFVRNVARVTSSSSMQVGQAHVATGVLLDLGTNSQPHRPENVAEHDTRASLTYTGQTGPCW